VSRIFALTFSLAISVLAGCLDGSDSNDKKQDADFSYPPSDCFWQIQITPSLSGDQNYGWPDLNTAYWGAVYTLPEDGLYVSVESKFPFARYMAYSNYYALGGTISTLIDKDISPGSGSINPFVPGNPRNDPSRIYPVTIRKIGDSSDENENVLYGADVLALLIYRVYLPVSGTDATGDGGLPRVALHMNDGSVIQGEEACEALNFPISADDRKLEWYTEDEYAGYRESQDPAQNPAKFRATYNFEFHKQCDFGLFCNSVPDISLKYPFPDPHYLYSFISRKHGEVLALRGKLPKTPHTYSGEDNVFTEGELRYWSLCNYEYFSQKAEDCAFDERVIINDDGFYTIVVSRESDKPTNATAECGVTYLSWSENGDGFGIIDGRENYSDDGFLVFRNILPAHTFTGVAPSPDTLDQEDSMGGYLPRARYFSKAEFEGLGCNPWLALPYHDI